MNISDNVIFDDYRKKKTYDINCGSGIGNRSSQQDCCYVAADDSQVMAVLCDGMGGAAGGRQASFTAAEAFVDYYQASGESVSNEDVSWVENAVRSVDDIVYSLKDENGKRIGCGTTLASVIIVGDRLFWVSVGDSRIYLIRGSEIAQITRDHNYGMELQMLYDAGKITRREFEIKSEMSDMLISFIGVGGLSLIEFGDVGFKINGGDVILICSDGVYRTIKDEWLLELIGSSRSMKTAASYINEAIRNINAKDQDNYTYVLIKKI